MNRRSFIQTLAVAIGGMTATATATDESAEQPPRDNICPECGQRLGGNSESNSLEVETPLEVPEHTHSLELDASTLSYEDSVDSIESMPRHSHEIQLPCMEHSHEIPLPCTECGQLV